MNDIITSLLGTITLPLVILLALGMMFGAKPSDIIGPFFSLVGAILTGLFKLLFGAVKMAHRHGPELAPPTHIRRQHRNNNRRTTGKGGH